MTLSTGLLLLLLFLSCSLLTENCHFWNQTFPISCFIGSQSCNPKFRIEASLYWKNVFFSFNTWCNKARNMSLPETLHIPFISFLSLTSHVSFKICSAYHAEILPIKSETPEWEAPLLKFASENEIRNQTALKHSCRNLAIYFFYSSFAP